MSVVIAFRPDPPDLATGDTIEVKVEPKHGGRTDWTGACPFHASTRHTLEVRAEVARWSCYACGAGGDAVSVRMRDGRGRVVIAAPGKKGNP